MSSSTRQNQTFKPIFVADWSSLPSAESSDSLLTQLFEESKPAPEQYYLSFPYSQLYELSKKHSGSGFIFGLDGLLSMAEGTFTESIAAKMPKEAGGSFVILGSYEQKKLFPEKGMNLSKKIKALLQEDVTPFVCIGENLEEYEANRTEEVLTEQLKSALQDLTPHQLLNIVIVYEAPWMSLLPSCPTLEQLQSSYQLCRELLRKRWDVQLANGIRLIGAVPYDFEDLSILIKPMDINGLYLSKAGLYIHQLQRLFSSDLILHEHFLPEPAPKQITPEETVEAVEKIEMPFLATSETESIKEEKEPVYLPTTDYTEEYFEIIPKESPEEPKPPSEQEKNEDTV